MDQANQKQADEVPIEVLAGFFAGEGCVSVRFSCKKHKTPEVIVEVGNTEKFWCDAFCKRFGGYVRVYFPKRYKNPLPYYHWTVKTLKAGDCLRELLPFLLGEKRQYALIALQVDAIKRPRNGKQGHYKENEIVAMKRLEKELQDLRRAVAETKRMSAQPMRSDSPILAETLVPQGAVWDTGQASLTIQ